MKEFITARKVWIDMSTGERKRLAEQFSISDDLSMVPFRNLSTEMQARLQTKADEENSKPAKIIITPQIDRLSVR